MIGTWEIKGETEHRPWTLTWVIRADNSYYFAGLFSDAGIIGSGDGKWHTISSVTGQRSEGTYSLPDHDHLNGTGPLGPGVWTRAGAAREGQSKPMASATPLSHDDEAQLISDFTNASRNHAARDRLEQKAQNGIAQAQVIFGLQLESEKNFAEAVSWYRKAVAQGEANAARNLAVCYLNGKGVTKDSTEALKWFHEAADLGNNEAFADMGDLYRDGEGVEKNASLAAEWYRKGADRGDSNAMNVLGACYWQGLGLENSPREAINWWKRAAEKDNANAKTNLQMALKKFDETGRPRDP
ncbi:MAG TPA: tetratricopeptide repeat protein [Chthoniobacterales bacterium]